MKIHTYLLNKTYIAQDSTTGLMAYAESEQSAHQQLKDLVAAYWEKRKVVVPINKSTETEKQEGKG